MGTRASFFIGDPQDMDGREWLGCIAWDGYPDGDCAVLALATSADEFRAAVAALAASRDDFCDPAKHGFPFPWEDDLFLTDYTYAFFGGAVQCTCFHSGFAPMAAFLAEGAEGEAFHEEYGKRGDTLPANVKAPAQYDRKAPDSIIIITARGVEDGR